MLVCNDLPLKEHPFQPFLYFGPPPFGLTLIGLPPIGLTRQVTRRRGSNPGQSWSEILLEAFGEILLAVFEKYNKYKFQVVRNIARSFWRNTFDCV